MPSARRHSTRLALLRLAGRLARAWPRRRQPPHTDTPRVLLLRPDHIGDVVLTSSAVNLLRTSLPRAHLTYMVGPWSLDVARAGPPVDRLATLDFPGFLRLRLRLRLRFSLRPRASLVAPYALLARHALRLRRERYDAAIVFRPDHWWGALLVSAAGIPLRIGADTPETRPLLSHARPLRRDEHAADQAIGIARLALEALGVRGVRGVQPRGDTSVEFRVTQRARARAASLWSTYQLDGSRVVIVQPSAGASLKSWPIQRWVRLVDILAADPQLHVEVLLTGAPSDAALLETIRQRCAQPPLVLSGQTIDDSAAIYERATLLVGLDGGAAHVAAAVGTPTVRVYGPAPVSNYGPWPPGPDQRALVTHALACVPCGHLENPPCGAAALPACMLAVSVEDVVREVRELLFSHG